jgi:hypothetical protein
MVSAAVGIPAVAGVPTVVPAVVPTFVPSIVHTTGVSTCSRVLLLSAFSDFPVISFAGVDPAALVVLTAV